MIARLISAMVGSPQDGAAPVEPFTVGKADTGSHRGPVLQELDLRFALDPTRGQVAGYDPQRVAQRLQTLGGEVEAGINNS
ncbi:hypothetical protein [Streptomyces sp. NPDC002779]|uniref:hypothetical protein n=1 Tax=Streptomyces sp. NPDC002779 TaxID=3364664 RepID=UPI0036B7ED53